MTQKESGKRAVMLDAAIEKNKEQKREQRRAERRKKFKRKPLQ
jgi:hypothetical protein